MDKSKIDPRLRQALDQAAPSDGVQAVIVANSPSGQPLPKEESEKMLRDIVDRAAKEVNVSPTSVVLFPYVQSFSIEAEPKLLNRILEDESIDAASLNKAL